MPLHLDARFLYFAIREMQYTKSSLPSR